MNLNHELIKFRLRAKGTSLADIARKLGVSRSVVTRVSKGTGTSAPISRAIADALGESVESVFPDRYPHNATA
jgi:Ner family transcriptional regulator